MKRITIEIPPSKIRIPKFIGRRLFNTKLATKLGIHCEINPHIGLSDDEIFKNVKYYIYLKDKDEEL